LNKILASQGDAATKTVQGAMRGKVMSEKKLTGSLGKTKVAKWLSGQVIKWLCLVMLTFLLPTPYFSLPVCYAEDAEVKLNSNDGSTGFIIQNQLGAPIYRTGSDGATVITGSATVNGNVGIGTTSSGQPLSVNGNIIALGDGHTYFSNPGYGIGKGSGVGIRLFTNIGTDMRLGHGEDASMPELTINSSGNVGIGTTNPGAKLHISGGGVRIDNMTVAGYIKNDTSGNLSGGNSIAPVDLPSSIDAAKIANGTVNSAEFQYLGGVTLPIQTQIDAKAPIASPTFTGTVSGITSTMVGLGNVTNESKATMFNSPTFTGTTYGITKAMVGLGSVDNTADTAKPVSTAQQTALNLKANVASPTFTGTVSGITKTMVGLGSVDNTADTAKPVSTAQQTALNLKANVASPTFTGTVSGITKAMVGLGSVDNTADTAKPVSTAQQTALNLKANLASPTFTGSVTMPGTGIWNSSGDVGIGTTAPGAKLHVINTSNVGYELISRFQGATGTGLYVYGDAFNNNTNVTLLQTTNGLLLDGNNTQNQLYLKSGGNVGIGTISPSYVLTVNGTAWCTSSAWSGSDVRWKRNIQTLTGALDKVSLMRGVSYEWKKEEYPDKKFDNGTQIGVIAQEVERIVPEIVTTDNEGYKGVSYERVVPLLIEAIKELKTDNENLQKEVEKLKEKK